MNRADWGFPTRIRIGAGRVADLPTACAEAGTVHPLVVTDTGLDGSAPLQVVRDALTATGHRHTVSAAVRPDPTEHDVSFAAAAYAEHGCDGVVAVGGGSALDVGKLVALAVRSGRSIWEYEDGVGVAHTGRRPGAVTNGGIADPAAVPVIAIPTTAGTGSEVGRAAVLTDDRTLGERVKRIIFHPSMLPASVICDPALTVGLPRHLTAGTGMDAFSHALEAYCSPVYHPPADGIATEAMRLIIEYLPVAVDRPDDLDARQQMLAAAVMGATAFQKGLGAMHALSHPLGAHAGTHHGTTNAVVMPYVLVANRPAIEVRIDGLAASLGIAGGFDGFVEVVLDLRRRTGIPATLAELGVSGTLADVVAAAAAIDPSASTNPVEVTVESARAMFDAAHCGDLHPAGTVAG